MKNYKVAQTNWTDLGEKVEYGIFQRKYVFFNMVPTNIWNCVFESDDKDMLADWIDNIHDIDERIHLKIKLYAL